MQELLDCYVAIQYKVLLSQKHATNLRKKSANYMNLFSRNVPVLALLNSSIATYLKSENRFQCHLCELEISDRLVASAEQHNAGIPLHNPFIRHMKVYIHPLNEQVNEQIYIS